MSPGVVVGGNPLKPQSLLEAKSQVRADQHDPCWFFNLSFVSATTKTAASVVFLCQKNKELQHQYTDSDTTTSPPAAGSLKFHTSLWVEGAENSNCYKLPLKNTEEDQKGEANASLTAVMRED